MTCGGVASLAFFGLQVSNEPGNRYNIQLINALVLYVGTQAIAHIHNKGSTPSMSTITHSAHMDIFQNLAVDLDTEGKDTAHAGHSYSRVLLLELTMHDRACTIPWTRGDPLLPPSWIAELCETIETFLKLFPASLRWKLNKEALLET